MRIWMCFPWSHLVGIYRQPAKSVRSLNFPVRSDNNDAYFNRCFKFKCNTFTTSNSVSNYAIGRVCLYTLWCKLISVQNQRDELCAWYATNHNFYSPYGYFCMTNFINFIWFGNGLSEMGFQAETFSHLVHRKLHGNSSISRRNEYRHVTECFWILCVIKLFVYK